MIDKEDAASRDTSMRASGSVPIGVYYTPVPISAKDLELMRQIDEIHLPIRSMAAGRFAMSCGPEAMTWDVTGCAA